MIHLFGVQGDTARDAEHRGLGALVGIETQVADAPGDHQADVPVVGFVTADGLHQDLDDLVPGAGDVEGDDLRRGVQPVDVAVEFEYPTVVGPDTLEHAVTVEETVVEDADLRVVFAVEPAVDVDLHEKPPGLMLSPPVELEVYKIRGTAAPADEERHRGGTSKPPLREQAPHLVDDDAQAESDHEHQRHVAARPAPGP